MERFESEEIEENSRLLTNSPYLSIDIQITLGISFIVTFSATLRLTHV